MKYCIRALVFCALATSLANAATVIDFESPYTLGALSSLTGQSNATFTGQQGWSNSTSNNVGNIITTTTSGNYTGGQGLTASTSGTSQTYIGAKVVDAFTSFQFDFRYYGTTELTVGGWFDVNGDNLFSQGETQFQAGLVDDPAPGAFQFGVRASGFSATRIGSGTTGTAGDWYRMTVTPDFGALTVTLGVFNLTTNSTVTLGTSVFNLTSGQFGVDPTTYDGVVARVTSTNTSPATIDNIQLVPEPSTGLLARLAVIGVLGVVQHRRRARSFKRRALARLADE